MDINVRSDFLKIILHILDPHGSVKTFKCITRLRTEIFKRCIIMDFDFYPVKKF